MRKGQKVWVAWGGNARKKADGNYLFAYNHDAKTLHALQDNLRNWLLGKRLLKPPFLYRLYALWLPLLLGLLTALVWLPMLVKLNQRPDLMTAEMEASHLAVFWQMLQPAWLLEHLPGDLPAILERNALRFAAIGAGVWLATLFVFNMVGYFLFLLWWYRLKMPGLRQRIVDACKE